MKMIEILGHNLQYFFRGVLANCTYHGENYEVWEVPEVIYEDMCNLTDETFVRLAGEEAWWRSSSGSNLKHNDRTHMSVNRHSITGFYSDLDLRSCSLYYFSSLSDYLCNYLGVSTETNVAAVTHDLAKINNMTLGELFTTYEPTEE